MKKVKICLCLVVMMSSLAAFAACGAELVSITLTQAPYKTMYYVGESFDCDGMVITANYSDNTSKVVSDYTVDKRTLVYGDTQVKVSYEGKTLSVPVAVVKYTVSAPTEIDYSFEGTALIVQAVDGVEYNFDNRGWTKDARFDGLVYGRDYVLKARYAETDTHNMSDEYRTMVRLEKQSQTAPMTVPYTVNGNMITLELSDTMETKLEEGNWSTNNVYDNLGYNREYTVYVRYKETEDKNPSEALEIRFITDKDIQLPPSGVDYAISNKDITFVLDGGMEISVNGKAWSKNTFYRELSYGKHKVQVRYAETDSCYASDIYEFEVEIKSFAEDYDYFARAYPSLKDEKDIRLHTITYDGLMTLLDTKGSYYLYFGGAWDDKSQANVKTVNDLAKKYDFEVYNFDLRLDGSGVYEELYLNAFGDIPAIEQMKSQLLYKLNSAAECRLYSANMFTDGAFMAVQVEEYGNITLSISDNQYSMENVAKAISAGKSDKFDRYGDSVFEQITYAQLTDILKSNDGSFEVLFVNGQDNDDMQAIDTAAKANGVKKIFVFDLDLSGNCFNDDSLAIHKDNALFGKLYAKLMDGLHGYTSDGSITVDGKEYPLMHTPTLMSFKYTADGKTQATLWAEYTSIDGIADLTDRLYTINGACALDELNAPDLTVGRLV